MNYYAWLISLRLKVLPLSLSAILVGNALAHREHQFNFAIFIWSLLTASLLQILSNLANDYGDAVKGSDTTERIGPMRAIQLGLLSLNQLRVAIFITSAFCVFSGAALLFVSCLTIPQFIGFLVLGLVAIFAAITYTAGKKPYGYIALGDLSVLIFFGLVGVMGSYYLQTKNNAWHTCLPALSSGLLAVGVLNMNNLRDIDSDRQHHKYTLAVMLGVRLTRYYHLCLLLLSLLLFSHFAYHHLSTQWGWSFIAAVPFFVYHAYRVFQFKTKQAAAPLLLQMVKLASITNLLFCMSIFLS